MPQSVYWYRLTPDAEEAGYRLAFVLGALLSRTMAYYIFKRFSEVDPARAHAKVTHERLKSFPIPNVDFNDHAQQKLHDEIVSLVRKLNEGTAAVGGPEDMRIDIALRELSGLTADDGLHIVMELAELPEGQVIRDLFPNGVPKQVIKTAHGAQQESLAVATP